MDILYETVRRINKSGKLNELRIVNKHSEVRSSKQYCINCYVCNILMTSIYTERLTV